MTSTVIVIACFTRFDKGVAVHRIERRNATNYYILTSAKIQQDRSARQLPRPNDGTAYASDSVSREGSEIKIYHYNSGLQTAPTVFVDSDDDYPPQLGIQYPVGFENGLNIDEFEGIRPDYRGTFQVARQLSVLSVCEGCGIWSGRG